MHALLQIQIYQLPAARKTRLFRGRVRVQRGAFFTFSAVDFSGHSRMDCRNKTTIARKCPKLPAPHRGPPFPSLSGLSPRCCSMWRRLARSCQAAPFHHRTPKLTGCGKFGDGPGFEPQSSPIRSSFSFPEQTVAQAHASHASRPEQGGAMPVRATVSQPGPLRAMPVPCPRVGNIQRRPWHHGHAPWPNMSLYLQHSAPPVPLAVPIQRRPLAPTHYCLCAH